MTHVVSALSGIVRFPVCLALMMTDLFLCWMSDFNDDRCCLYSVFLSLMKTDAVSVMFVCL